MRLNGVKIKNIYKTGGLPMEKAEPVGNTVLLIPILPHDFLGDLGELQMSLSAQKVSSKAADGFYIFKCGPEVKNPELLLNRVTIIASERLDYANPDGTWLIANASDITHTWSLESLEESLVEPLRIPIKQVV